ncbi:MAG: 4Fe-4S dicluster domain-containing protein [Coriobacteriia bacterium]|nr:4Fe-4S dicluster domain-containing protein [Coriobacteriia bacterium]
MQLNNRRISGRADLLKWAIWIPWISLIIIGVVNAGGYHTLDVFYGTVGGISVAGDADRPIIAAYAIYFAVVMLFFGLSLALGRRGGCHTVCWMAPFMITGRAVRNVVSWPSLRLAADRSSCTACGSCTAACPMSIDVQALVATGSMKHAECVLCGTCVDGCSQHAIRYTFSSGK